MTYRKTISNGLIGKTIIKDRKKKSKILSKFVMKVRLGCASLARTITQLMILWDKYDYYRFDLKMSKKEAWKRAKYKAEL